MLQKTPRRKQVSQRARTKMAHSLVLAVTAAAVSAATGAADAEQKTVSGTTVVVPAVSESVATGSTSSIKRTLVKHKILPVDQGLSSEDMLARARERMEADHREIDSGAARLKEIIKARYEAEAENGQLLMTIRELREKISGYETLLKNARQQQLALGTDKDAIEDRLNEVRNERDQALKNLGLIDSQLQDQLGTVQALQSKGQVADRELADKKKLIADLNQQIDELTGERDDALARGEQVEKLLVDNRHALDKLTGDLADVSEDLERVAAEKDRAQNALAANQAILKERENKLSRLDGLVTDKTHALGALERQMGDNAQAVLDMESTVNRLTAERDDARDELASAQAMINDKTQQLGDLQKQLNEVTVERDQTQTRLDGVENLLADKVRQIAALDDRLDKLVAEQKEHKKTQANLISVQQREADKLQGSLDALKADKEKLLDDTAALNTSRAQLRGELQATRKELETRQNELKSALSAIANLNQRIAKLGKERDMLSAKVNALGNEVVALNTNMDDAKVRFESEMADRSQQHAGQIDALQSDLAKKDRTIALLNKDVDGVTADLEEEKNRSAKIIADKQSEIAGLQDKIDSLTNTRQQLSLAKQQSQHDIDKLGDSIDSLTESRDKSLAEIDRLAKVNKELNSALSDANKNYEALTKDTESQLAALEQKILDITESRDSHRGKAAKLESLNEELADKLQLNRRKLDMVSAQSTEKAQLLSDQLAKLLSKEKLYRSNALETGEKLHDMVRQNNALKADLASARQRNAQLQQDIAAVNDDMGVYQAELFDATQMLNEITEAQRLAEAERDRIAAESEALRVSLTDELDKARLEHITVEKAREDNSIPLRLGNADFFETGSAELTKAGGEKLTQLAKIIHNHHDRRIVVEGHTDNVPIGQRLITRFASNWELSVARAAAAVRHMQKHTDIDPRNLSAAGYGEFKPVGDNSTAEGKQLNRRVEVVLYPRASKYRNIEDITSISAIDE